MTNSHEKSNGGITTSPDLYEFWIAGTIGPLIQSCLSGLTTVAESEWTLLTGTARGSDDLRRILNLLDAQGGPVVNVRITPTRDHRTQ